MSRSKSNLSNLELLGPVVVVMFIIGITLGAAGTFLYFHLGQQLPIITRIHSTQTQYPYIDPLLASEVSVKLTNQNSTLVNQMELLVNQYKKDKKINDVIVYFRDIEAGTWAGINEDSAFTPGKLLKIPLMITYYKLAEDDSSILDQKLQLTNKYPAQEDILGTPKHLVIDQEYTVEQLIEAMIVDSDDRAANLLFDNVDKTKLNEVFSDLGINFKEDKETQDYISLKSYSLFFRLLYNSTYLTREYSEKALELLLKADNTVGLGAGIPKDVPVANRHGAIVLTNGNTKTYQMSDCGVFYYPKHPYLVCASVKGNTLSDVETFLANLGKKIYVQTELQYKQ